ncbi:nitrous oxide reductase accessory protein NosL [Brevibacillus sp. AF8]|uniref:nitrous oxide reductase accessory protein NosL n=1 Tax=Brevibacillus sp. AF8 TaxID=2825881 RepID=UPI001E537B4D|nr:nitrous oxide reductase accessory protein NosL [Brevibacillus sp. AF8]MCE0450474.1 nitrous oxide reductase accessory protein NosL [Brevibacillus sp. AF8]
MNKMKKWGTTIGAILGISLLMVGCGSEEPKPVDIAEGVDKCDLCKMHVPNDHNATEIVLKDGKALKFDDLGCMYNWTKENGTDNVAVQFVRDYYTAEWTKAEQATYAYDKDFKTPMTYGIYSFKEKSAADGFVQEQKKGIVMSAEQLKNHSWENGMSKHMNKDGHSSEGQHNGGHESKPADHGSNSTAPTTHN